MHRLQTFAHLLLTLAITTALVAAPVSARPQDETERGTGDFGFIRLRPLPTKAKPSRKRATYKPAAKPSTPRTEPPDSAAETLVGVTLWRLRPSQKADAETARILVHEDDSSSCADAEWTPERVDVDTALAEGQHVRFAIETPRDGYLYIVDREVYADGTTSPPVLVFPTTRTRGGDNRVTAGAVVEIPALSDNPVYLTLKKSRPDHVAESLTVIVAPAPIEGLTIGRSPLLLTAAQMESWQTRWGGPVERVDLANGLGTPYTKVEETAGANPSARLTQEDPVPQTIYRIAGHAGAPALVTFELKVASSQ